MPSQQPALIRRQAYEEKLLGLRTGADAPPGARPPPQTWSQTKREALNNRSPQAKQPYYVRHPSQGLAVTRHPAGTTDRKNCEDRGLPPFPSPQDTRVDTPTHIPAHASPAASSRTSASAAAPKLCFPPLRSAAAASRCYGVSGVLCRCVHEPLSASWGWGAPAR